MMTEEERNRRILEARKLIHWDENEDYETDQQLRRIQPPLFKEPMSGENLTLPLNFEDLPMEGDYRKILRGRKSSRVFTMEEISLLALSFLLYSAAGVRDIRGKQYATMRTAPSGGARHPFEVYLAVLRVEGLAPGLYHYQPKDHTLELLEKKELDDGFLDSVNASVCGQAWVKKASAVLYYSLIPYRAEWRYAQDAHRVMMMDAGHTMENVYLSCSALGLGACAIAAVSAPVTDRLFGLDGEEEFSLCCVPVGTVKAEDAKAEQEFYAFLRTEEQYYHE